MRGMLPQRTATISPNPVGRLGMEEVRPMTIATWVMTIRTTQLRAWLDNGPPEGPQNEGRCPIAIRNPTKNNRRNPP